MEYLETLPNLVSIVLLLQAHRQLTAEQIAERLDVSARTVYRDVETLVEDEGDSPDQE